MSMSKRPGGTKNRGRTKIGGNDTAIGNRGAVQLEKRTEATRPVGKSSTRGGKNRGDRRDTSKAFTNNTRVKRSGTNPPGKAGERRNG